MNSENAHNFFLLSAQSGPAHQHQVPVITALILNGKIRRTPSFWLSKVLLQVKKLLVRASDTGTRVPLPRTTYRSGFATFRQTGSLVGIRGSALHKLAEIKALEHLPDTIGLFDDGAYAY